MAMTLTGLIPDLYQALDVVSREQVGMIPAVMRDSSAERAALNEDVLTPIVPASTAADITPGVTAPNTGDAAIGNAALTITKSRMVPIRWNGEETKGLSNSGLYPSVQQQRYQQAFRTLCNEVESDLASLFIYASRAYGTGAGTSPFGTAGDLSDNAGMLRILEENGAPGDIHGVLGAGAIQNIRGKQSVLFKANEAGTTDLLRRGIIGDIEGVRIHNSGQIKTPASGTAASYTSSTAGHAIGVTSIALITGTGTILAGDILNIAGDANQYVVKTGIAAPGTVVIQEPGLKKAIAASAVNVTVKAASERSLYFARSAIALVTRAPAMPEGGDQADDVVEIVDPVSGLAFQVAMYRQYRQTHLEIGLAWGQAVIAPRHLGILLG